MRRMGAKHLSSKKRSKETRHIPIAFELCCRQLFKDIRSLLDAPKVCGGVAHGREACPRAM